MRLPVSIRWIALALAGLAVAASVSLAASQLVSERIGLAAEPVSAGKELAPGREARNRGSDDAGKPERRDQTTTPAPTTAGQAPTTTTAPPATSQTTTTAPPTPSTTSPAPSDSGTPGEREGADD